MSIRFRGYRYRARGRHVLRKLVILFLVIWMASYMFADIPFIAVPMAVLGTLLALPIVLLGLLIAALSMLLPLLVMAAVFGLPSIILYRIFFGRGRREEAELSFRPAVEGTEVSRLRRRYLAGELTDSEFQFAMMDALKERFARGKMTVSEYERELDQLLRRGRVLDEGLSTPALDARDRR